jgi:hypothetical protein
MVVEAKIASEPEERRHALRAIPKQI